jgi:hypothetical protein
MTKCRPDTSAAAIKLSHYMDNPASEHYIALREVCRYLTVTVDEGFYYWREEPVNSLPEVPLPSLHADNHDLEIHLDSDGTPLSGYVNSDWGPDKKHHRSVTGMVIMYAGGAVGWKSKYQGTIAHSSTEAEFVAACDAGKFILFYRSLLSDLGIKQHGATTLFEDKKGALLMANAQQPTQRTHHMDIKHFAILEWVEWDLLVLKTISTSGNAADGFTKSLTKQLFYHHFDTYMGRRVPSYLHIRGNRKPPTTHS